MLLVTFSDVSAEALVLFSIVEDFSTGLPYASYEVETATVGSDEVSF